MEKKILEWNEIKNKYQDSLILGNGSSIAINEKFKYESLYEKAKEMKLIDNELKTLFERFSTHDFESILHKLLQAWTVNQSLSIDNQQIAIAYNSCRSALIEIIQKIHPQYNEIEDNVLDKTAIFLNNFKRIITLNYDLILYWSIYRGNLPRYDSNGNILEEGNLFKDGFIDKVNGDKCFNHDWGFLEEPHKTRKKSILIFYLHGNLSLANLIKDKIYELDVKITSPDNTHLEAIFEKWKSENYSPLFVCEGEEKNKLTSIKNSNYLSIVYYDVLSRVGDSIAFYGFNFNEQDNHIISRLGDISRKYPIRNIAISVYRDGSEENYMQRVSQLVNNKIGRNIEVDFFDSRSKDCWNN